MGKRIDLTGQRFDRLLVTSYSHSSKAWKTYWNVLCDCGKTKVVWGSSLKRGEVRSCGCLHRVDLTEQRFGRLVVTSYSHSGKNREAYWSVLCDCGGKKVVIGSALRNGRTKSCGCLRVIDMAGKRFGRLKVLSYSHIGENGGAYWGAVCDCGNEVVVDGQSLRKGCTKSCGCLRIADMVEERFGRLVVLSYSRIDKGRGAHWNVLCDCGSEIVVRGTSLREGNTKSCGCLRREMLCERMKNKVGKLHPMWNKNKTDEERHAQRKYYEYREWRKGVFARDMHTCQKCDDIGGELNAHHKEGYANNEEVRTELSNGVTLSVKCHQKFHLAYGYGDNTREQYSEWAKS